MPGTKAALRGTTPIRQRAYAHYPRCALKRAHPRPTTSELKMKTENISSTQCFIHNFQFSIPNFPGPALIQASSALHGLAPSGRSLLLRLLLPDMALYCAEVYHRLSYATKRKMNLDERRRTWKTGWYPHSSVFVRIRLSLPRPLRANNQALARHLWCQRDMQHL